MTDSSDQSNLPPTLSNLQEIQQIIAEGESGMMSVEQAQELLDSEEARLKKLHEERYLDPLHVQTPLLQRIQREYPKLNTTAGSANWIILANAANLIVALRTKKLSSEAIETEIKENVHNFFGVLYKRGLISRP